MFYFINLFVFHIHIVCIKVNYKSYKNKTKSNYNSTRQIFQKGTIPTQNV